MTDDQRLDFAPEKVPGWWESLDEQDQPHVRVVVDNRSNLPADFIESLTCAYTPCPAAEKRSGEP